MPDVPEAVRPAVAPRPPYADPGEWSRFRAKVVVTSRCWIWCGALGDDGYGRFWAAPIEADSRASSMVRPSRWTWAAHHGPIRAGLVVRHDCDLTPCARYECLRDGTQSDNLLDAFRRDRITNGARLGRADKRGASEAARAVRTAVLEAVHGGMTDPAELSRVVTLARAGGDPYKDQIPLW